MARLFRGRWVDDGTRPQPLIATKDTMASRTSLKHQAVRDAQRKANRKAKQPNIPPVRSARVIHDYEPARVPRTRHPHPVATRLQVVIELIIGIRSELDNIPTTYSSNNTITGTRRATPSTIARNQVDEVMERFIPHLQRALTYAKDLK